MHDRGEEKKAVPAGAARPIDTPESLQDKIEEGLRLVRSKNPQEKRSGLKTLLDAYKKLPPDDRNAERIFTELGYALTHSTATFYQNIGITYDLSREFVEILKKRMQNKVDPEVLAFDHLQVGNEEEWDAFFKKHVEKSNNDKIYDVVVHYSYTPSAFKNIIALNYIRKFCASSSSPIFQNEFRILDAQIRGYAHYYSALKYLYGWEGVQPDLAKAIAKMNAILKIALRDPNAKPEIADTAFLLARLNVKACSEAKSRDEKQILYYDIFSKLNTALNAILYLQNSTYSDNFLKAILKFHLSILPLAIEFEKDPTSRYGWIGSIQDYLFSDRKTIPRDLVTQHFLEVLRTFSNSQDSKSKAFLITLLQKMVGGVDPRFFKNDELKEVLEIFNTPTLQEAMKVLKGKNKNDNFVGLYEKIIFESQLRGPAENKESLPVTSSMGLVDAQNKVMEEKKLSPETLNVFADNIKRFSSEQALSSVLSITLFIKQFRGTDPEGADPLLMQSFKYLYDINDRYFKQLLSQQEEDALPIFVKELKEFLYAELDNLTPIQVDYMVKAILPHVDLQQDNEKFKKSDGTEDVSFLEKLTAYYDKNSRQGQALESTGKQTLEIIRKLRRWPQFPEMNIKTIQNRAKENDLMALVYLVDHKFKNRFGKEKVFEKGRLYLAAKIIMLTRDLEKAAKHFNLPFEFIKEANKKAEARFDQLSAKYGGFQTVLDKMAHSYSTRELADPNFKLGQLRLDDDFEFNFIRDFSEREPALKHQLLEGMEDVLGTPKKDLLVSTKPQAAAADPQVSAEGAQLFTMSRRQ